VTALNFYLQETQVLIVADTLVTNASFAPAFFTTKIHPVPHWNGLICGTGDLGLILEWHRQALGNLLARDISHLDEYVPECLRRLREGRSTDTASEGTSTIYHFGLDEIEDRFVGFAYRSTNNFQSERLRYGLSFKPPFDIGERKLEEFPRDFVKMCLDQRIAQENLPIEQRVFIGGHVTAYRLDLYRQAEQDSNVIISISRPFKFDDFNANFETCIKGLPANA
jgi:hypothetical protein